MSWWGVFWRRGTKEAALTTLALGFGLGLIAFAVDLPLITIYEKTNEEGLVVAQQLITERWGIPFMMQAWWGFCICSVIYVLVSLMTPRPSSEQLEGLTWSDPLAFITKEEFRGLSDPRLISGALLLIMIGMYSMFG